MATLKVFEVADPHFGGSNTSLRHWLDGRWAILFSHPDDFVQRGPEFDRWLVTVGEAFARARVRPLALPRSSYPIDHGWISQLSGSAAVSLHDHLHAQDAIDLHACRLQDEILGVRKRFAMIIDGTLRPRTTHTYGMVENPPSPLDFVRLACRQRAEQAHEERACEQGGGSDRLTVRVAASRHLTPSPGAFA